MRSRARQGKAQGFTIMEAIVIIVIISILVILVVPQFFIKMERARLQEALNIMPLLYQAQEEYYQEHKIYATDIASLDVEVSSLKNFEAIALENAVAMQTELGNLWRIAKTQRKDIGGQVMYSLFLDSEEGRVFCKDEGSHTYCQHFGLPESDTAY